MSATTDTITADKQTKNPSGTKQLTEDQIAELSKYAKVASRARGAYYSEEVADASRKFTALLAQHLESGVPLSELGRATGLQWRSIKARLFRHGHLPAPPSQKHKQFQGPKKAGPNCQHDSERYRERIDKKTGKVTHVECLTCRNNRRAERLAERAESERSASAQVAA